MRWILVSLAVAAYAQDYATGVTIGETDEYGMKAIADPVPIHDLHATMLHLFGLDYTRLTHRYQGRDFRLTDTAGSVVRKLI